jgi:cyclohexyl-isocyanide hydratase
MPGPGTGEDWFSQKGLAIQTVGRVYHFHSQPAHAMKVAILVFPGVEELDFVGFLEPLAVANRVTGKRHFETKLVGTERGPVICSGGMKLLPDQTLSRLEEYDLLFVPGGGASRGTGVDLLMKNRQVLDKLNESYLRGKRIWSVCTGALVLGEAGLLKGMRATTHHISLDQLRAAGAKVVSERVVTDGRVTTGGGISSSIDLGLSLVEGELGEDVKREVEVRMEYHPQMKVSISPDDCHFTHEKRDLR